jgi:hypothetical protein
MQLDIHVPRFTWPGSPASIGSLDLFGTDRGGNRRPRPFGHGSLGGRQPAWFLREAEALAAVGVHAIMARSTGPEPARWLEEVWAPVLPQLAAIETAT